MAQQAARQRFEGLTTAAIGIFSFLLLRFCFLRIIRMQRKSNELTQYLENASCLLPRHRFRRANSRRSTERKSTTIAVVTVAAFTTCWFPYCSYHIILATGVLDPIVWASRFHEYFHALTYCNSCISVSIFVFTALLKYLKKRWLRRSRTKTITSNLSSV